MARIIEHPYPDFFREDYVEESKPLIPTPDYSGLSDEQLSEIWEDMQAQSTVDEQKSLGLI